MFRCRVILYLKVLNGDVYERDVTDRQEPFNYMRNTRLENKNGGVAELRFNEYFRIILFKTLLLKIPLIWDMRRHVIG